MVAGLGTSRSITSHEHGIGRVRERTIAIGAQVIAIDNIGTLEIVRGQRSWILLVVGLAIAAAAATQLQIYSIPALAGIGLGAALVIANLTQKVQHGLLIGASDGRGALVASRDEIFLRKLLALLTAKINTRSEALLGSFDITHGSVDSENAAEAGEPPPPEPPPRARAEVPIVSLASARTETSPEPMPEAVGQEPEPAEEPEASPPKETDDASDSLFGDIEETLPIPPPEPVRPAPAPLVIRAERRVAHDPLLDGPVVRPAVEDDWLSAPRSLMRPPDRDLESGGAGRILLALLIIIVLAGSVFAAWYFSGQTGPATSISLIADAAVRPAEIRGSASAEALTAADAGAVIESGASDAAGDAFEASEYLSPEPMVARSSGLDYRSAPSSNAEVLSQTRAGGEALRIDGGAVQGDGEWYRVTLLDGRTAWFRASQAVPRSRFSETLRASPAGAAFADSAPRILEPAEGVVMDGGPQRVLLAWSALAGAGVYVVEVEAYDVVAQRWQEDALIRRVPVESGAELSEDIPSAGFWRWRVRGESPSGESSQFSRWAAFGIRE